MKFYVIVFGRNFYRKKEMFMTTGSLSLVDSLKEARWFRDYEDAKRTAKRFGGEVKECSVSDLEDLDGSK